MGHKSVPPAPLRGVPLEEGQQEPSANASYPTLRPSQPSSSRRSAAARSDGSMRTSSPGMSPSRDRASSYVGPPSLQCATGSRVAPASGGSPRMVAALHPHVCLSVAWSTWAVLGRRRGEWDARMSQDTSPFHPTWGPDAARSLSAAAVSWVIRARPRNHGGPWPDVWPSALERDDGVLRRGGPLPRAWWRTTGPIHAPTPRPLCGPPTW